ncbi:SDR family NAD(P)-dependent oxidoreductase, partial [Thermocatellispora tengchongensis]
WALRGLSRIASMELGPRSIRVNSILPGYIESPMQNATPQLFIDAHLSLIPLQRTGTPKDVAPVVTFLMSDASSWITGVDIPVDGGAVGHVGLKVISDAMTAATNGA